jgi:NAD(P)-dependent dehydrogenase (short-subunit alcohol dehydrogenase family)
MTATSSSPALVTGAATGIGHATARVLHADGYGRLRWWPEADLSAQPSGGGAPPRANRRCTPAAAPAG